MDKSLVSIKHSGTMVLHTYTDLIWIQNTLEEQLYKLEGAYLEDTPSGNVVRGFENYVKGSQTKKRIGLSEQDRVFSMSSAVFLKAKMKEEDEKNQ